MCVRSSERVQSHFFAFKGVQCHEHHHVGVQPGRPQPHQHSGSQCEQHDPQRGVLHRVCRQHLDRGAFRMQPPRFLHVSER